MNVKRVLYGIVAIILIFTLSPEITSASSKMPDGTKVGHIEVEDRTGTEIETMLGDEIIIWQADDDLELSGEFETLTVSREAFTFNIEATLSELHDRTKRKISTFFKRPKNVYIPLHVKVDEEHADIVNIKDKPYIDYEAALNNLTQVAQDLGAQPIALTYVEDEEIPLETVAKVKLDKPKLSKATIDYVVDELDGLLLQPEQLFSFLEAIDTSDKLLNSRDESSFLATGLYALFLQADFEIISRHPQLTLPAYGEKGINAEVNQKDKKDLIVLNKSESTYRLKIKNSKETMTFKLEGNEPSITYEIDIENEKEISPRTIYRYSKKLDPGAEEVIQAGSPGLTLDVIRSLYEEGTHVSDAVISRDLYLPSPRILLVSPDEVEEVPEEDVEVELGEDGKIFDEEMTVDEEGNIIRPDGSSGGSIFDVLEDIEEIEEIENEGIFDEMFDLEEAQKEYEKYLDQLLDIYASNTADVEEAHLEKIQAVTEQIIELEEQLEALVKELIDQELIDKDFLKQDEGGEKK